MTATTFFKASRQLTAGEAADAGHAQLKTPDLSGLLITSVASIGNARAGALVFSNGSAKADVIRQLRSCVLICTEAEAANAPEGVAVIVSNKPQQAFVSIVKIIHPDASRPTSYVGGAGISPFAIIDPSATIEADVTIETGAVVGAHAQIGSGTTIGARAVIGSGVAIGRDCSVGPGSVVTHALIGNQVIIHAGACIGQDGFGFIAGPAGLEKMPQLGRVIIQDKVEIGANTTIDRGALDDTVIGEGTKIDNLVQIAHNCRIGRYCVIAGHCGLSGSVTLGDGVMLGGRVGVADHVTIATRAQVAAASAVMNDIGEGQRWAGLPAQPIKEFFRELAIIRSLAREKRSKRDDQ